MGILQKLLKIFQPDQTPARRLNTIDPAVLNLRLTAQQEIVVLDVRNADEFAGPLGHISGALNLPLAELQQRHHELHAYRERPIVVVCLTDKRSTQAIAQLADAGFANLLLLSGGMKAWSAAHLPVADKK